MKLYEYQGLDLFEKYGIAVPQRQLLESSEDKIGLQAPLVLKAQVLAWDRKRAGGVVFASSQDEIDEVANKLFGKDVCGEVVERVLVQEKLDIQEEYYVSFSYDTDSRCPVLALSTEGGTGTDSAEMFPIDILEGVSGPLAQECVRKAGFLQEDIEDVASVVTSLWELFIKERARVAEINPLVKTRSGDFIAADAKVTLDGKEEHWSAGQTVDMDGDIAIIASSGGASLLNLDALLRVGGRPANYTEYSGNPPADVVVELTNRILGREGIRGLWVIGGTASFTDVYETMGGFIEGLRHIKPKPTYPIVIRRDGPRKKEAFAMLAKVKEDEGFDLHVYDSHTPMAETARIIVDLAYGEIL